MAFKDLLKSDAVSISDPTIGHAESVTYWPLGVSTGARTLNAFIFRGEPAPLPENPNVMRTAAVMLVPVDATSGVATIKPNQDKFLFPLRAGDGTTSEWKVSQVLKKDWMFWTVEVVR